MTSEFPKWFMKQYRKWTKAQQGKEDFLGFCSELGFPPYKVIDWIHGDSTPTNTEILCIASLFGFEVYDVRGLERPEQELLDIYGKFSHLCGEYRSNLSHALYETNLEIESNNLSINTEGMKAIVQKTMKKWNIS